MERLDLFPVRAYWYDVPDAAVLNRDLKADILEWRGPPERIPAVQESPWRDVRRPANRSNGWRSDLYAHERPRFRRLADLVEDAGREVFQAEGLQGDPRIMAMWANVNDRGGGNFPHGHGFTLWVGVYYVDCPPGSPPTVLMPPHEVTSPRQYEAPAVPGRMFLFPGQMIHFVRPHPGEEPRITISFNMVQVITAGAKETIRCG